MDAVDCPGHVLLVINVCGLREESLGEKPAGYSHQKHHYMSHRERDEERRPLPPAVCSLWPVTARPVSPAIYSQHWTYTLSVRERPWGHILNQGLATDTALGSLDTGRSLKVVGRGPYPPGE